MKEFNSFIQQGLSFAHCVEAVRKTLAESFLDQRTFFTDGFQAIKKWASSSKLKNLKAS
jgi:hypothetical protein